MLSTTNNMSNHGHSTSSNSRGGSHAGQNGRSSPFDPSNGGGASAALGYFQHQQQHQHQQLNQQGVSRRSNNDADNGNMDDVQFSASLDALLNDQLVGGSTTPQQQQQLQLNHHGVSRRSSDADIGSMDDVQFSASLDALLNDQLVGVSTTPQPNNNNSINHHHNNCSNAAGTEGNRNDGFPQSHQHQQQIQHALSNSQQFFLGGAPGNGIALAAALQAAPNRNQALGGSQLQGSAAPQQHNPNQRQQQLNQIQQQQQQLLAGLSLASANQAVLHLAPPGPHSAAQMSLSAGHAAATGAFHPGNPNAATGLPQLVAGQGQSFPWAAISSIAASAPIAPSPASFVGESSTAGLKRPPPGNDGCDGGGKRSMNSVSAVSEDEGDRKKRRQERNIREQQRSHKITEQIAQLKEVLSEANIQFKPDKYSTLTKVVELIQELQDRSKVLDAEHRKLLDTISETNEIVNNQYVPAYTSGSDTPSISNDLLADGSSSSMDDESMVYMRGIDYRIAFKNCGIPLALASIDGRFLDCNKTFLELTGYARDELLPLEDQQGDGNNNAVRFSPDQGNDQKKNLSLFNLISRNGMEQVFVAMSEMLKQPGSIGTPEAKPTEESKLADFWSGPVTLCRRNNLPVRFLLSCPLNEVIVPVLTCLPFFFSCSLGQIEFHACAYLSWKTQVLQLCFDGLGP